MTGFEPRTSGIGSDRSTNWATTTALGLLLLQYVIKIFKFLLSYSFEGTKMQQMVTATIGCFLNYLSQKSKI